MKYHIITYLFKPPNFVELESGRCRLQSKVVSVQQILLHHVEVTNHEESETSFNKTADFSPHILGYLYEGLRKYSFILVFYYYYLFQVISMSYQFFALLRTTYSNN